MEKINMNCKNCECRKPIIDEELMDVVGYKCILTGTIISADVEDGEKERGKRLSHIKIIYK